MELFFEKSGTLESPEVILQFAFGRPPKIL